jgi:hypothetical protein
MTSEEEAPSRTISLYSHRAHIRLEQIQEATRFLESNAQIGNSGMTIKLVYVYT